MNISLEDIFIPPFPFLFSIAAQPFLVLTAMKI